MLAKFRAALTVLNKGEELTHKETWKNATTLTNLLVALLGAIAVFLPESLGLSADDISTLAGAIAIIAGLFTSYTTTATSVTVGLPQRGGNPDDSSPDNSRLSDNVTDGSA
jgi:hypothetical protein